MEEVDKYEYLKSGDAYNKGIRDMLYQVLINGENHEADYIFFMTNRINQPRGIFQIEYGKIIPETVQILHTISDKLNRIQSGDTIVRIHVQPPTQHTNPDNKSSKELMVDGMKRVRDEIRNLLPDKRPKYFMSYSHITNKLGNKYNFKTYDIPEDIKKHSGSGMLLDQEAQKRWEDIIKSRKEDLNNPNINLSDKEDIKKNIEKREIYLKLSDKYSTDDIKLIVEPIENLLNITDEYFEQLKKPSS